MNRRHPILPELPPLPRLMPRWTHAGYLVLLTALTVRTAAMLALGGQMDDNPNVDGYAKLAENLAQYGVLGRVTRTDEGRVVRHPSAYRPPLYPVLLGLTAVDRRGELRLRRVAVLHVLMGAATTMLVWQIAIRCGLGSWALAAAAVTLLDPLLLNQAALVMTETLATLLVAAALWFCCLRRQQGRPRHDVATGLALGLAALCRPSFLPWIGLLLLWEAVRFWREGDRDQLGRLAVVGVVVALTLAPWTIRNAKQLGRATPTTTHGGYTLLLGNNPDFYRHLNEAPWGSVWDASQLDRERMQWMREHDMDEVAADRDSYTKAIDAITAEPGDFLYSSLVRLGRFWSPLPHQLSPDESRGRLWLRRLTSLWYDAVFVLAIVGLTVIPRRRLAGPWREGLLLALSLTLVHMVFWSNMRMRAPLTPFLSLLAAAGLALIFSREDELERVESCD